MNKTTFKKILLGLLFFTITSTQAEYLNERAIASIDNGVNSKSTKIIEEDVNGDGYNDMVRITNTDAFITKWQVTSPLLAVDIPIDDNSTIPYNYNIDWGDGTTEANSSVTKSHTYANAGTYTIKITGVFPRILFTDSLQLLEVVQWGTTAWTDMSSAFRGCANLTSITSTEAPILSNVIAMSNMFEGASSFNGNVSTWDVSNVIAMSNMFEGASSFNGDVSTWDVSNVTAMKQMFEDASSFNGDVSNWDVSNVTDMARMFYQASLFNGDVSTWDVSNVSNMARMFFEASLFNGDLSAWNVGKVLNMSFMFNATSFNADVSAWNVVKVKNMEEMFKDATLFNRDVSAWNVGNVDNMLLMFDGADAFSAENYNKLLIGWISLPTLKTGVSFGAPNVISNCPADTARSLLGSTYGWIIAGDGESSCERWVGGSTGSDWDTGSNWDSGSVPTGTTNVGIATGTTITASGDITVNNLTLDASSALTVAGNINNSGDVLLKAGSSLIATDSSPFNFTYNRTIATSNWYVISSPTLNQNIDEFVASSDLASGTGSNLAFGTYDTTANTWAYYQSGASANSDVFNSATGYIMKLSGGSGDIDFSGTMPTNDSFAIPLSTTGNGFNLIGNPYPSFMNSADVLSNSTSTAAIETQTIWVWDQSANGGVGGYEVKVTGDNFKVAPGQGFFVQADSDGGDVLISEAEQSHEATDTFAKNENTRPEVHLSMTDGSLVSDTKMYYIDGTTTEFDNGYDGPLFTAADNSFAVYTQLVTGNKGIDYDLQSLPSSGYESMIIPVGVNAVSGTEITFSARSINIPDGLSVILENRITGTYTELNQEIDTYTVTLNEDNSGIGQFYIHTNTMSTLSTGGFIFENVSMYKTTARNIRITGLPEGKGSLKMYSILGQEVFRTSFEGARVNDIQLPSSLKSGIFIVKLETETGSFTKKVILE